MLNLWQIYVGPGKRRSPWLPHRQQRCSSFGSNTFLFGPRYSCAFPAYRQFDRTSRMIWSWIVTPWIFSSTSRSTFWPSITTSARVTAHFLILGWNHIDLFFSGDAYKMVTDMKMVLAAIATAMESYSERMAAELFHDLNVLFAAKHKRIWGRSSLFLSIWSFALLLTVYTLCYVNNTRCNLEILRLLKTMIGEIYFSP